MDNQPQFRADIYEGERARTHDNIKIGTILMENLTPAPRGSTHVVSFEGKLFTDAGINIADRFPYRSQWNLACYAH